MAKRSREELEIKAVTMSAKLWRAVRESWRITDRIRGRGGKITPEMAASLDGLCRYLDANLPDSVTDKQGLQVTAPRDSWAYIAQYLACVPHADCQEAGKAAHSVAVQTSGGEWDGR